MSAEISIVVRPMPIVPPHAVYDRHPEHVAFVRDRWDAEVTDFQEIDFAAR